MQDTCHWVYLRLFTDLNCWLRVFWNYIRLSHSVWKYTLLVVLDHQKTCHLTTGHYGCYSNLSDLKSHFIKPVVRQVFFWCLCVGDCVHSYVNAIQCPHDVCCLMGSFWCTAGDSATLWLSCPSNDREQWVTPWGSAGPSSWNARLLTQAPHAMWIKAARQGKSWLLRETALRKTHFPAIGS